MASGTQLESEPVSEYYELNNIEEVRHRQNYQGEDPKHDIVGRSRLDDLELETTVQELPSIDVGWKAWRFCICAFLIEVVIWGFEFSYGIFQDYYASNPPFENESSVTITAVGTTAIAIQYGETMFLSLFFERYPDLLRVGGWVGLGLCAFSLLMASFVKQIWQLVYLQGVLFGIGGGLTYYPILVMLPQWFVRRRGLATGIIFSGSGIGGFAFPFLFEVTLSRIGFRWTLRIWSMVTLVLGGVAVLGMQPRLPVPKFQRGQKRPRFIPPDLQFVRTAFFWMLGANTMLQAMAFYSVSLYIATFAKVISTSLTASIVLALFNSSGVVGELIIGHLCDKLPHIWIAFIITLGSGVAAFLLWGFGHTLPILFAFSIIFGGLMGGYFSMGTTAAADCAGNKPELTSMIFASSFLLKGVAVVIGPIIAGILYDIGKSSAYAGDAKYGAFGFEAVELFVGSCAVATSLSSVLMAVSKRRMRA